MRKFKLAAAVAAGLCGLYGNVQAQEGPAFKFSGFGTVGATRSNVDKADFVSTQHESEGTGHTRNTDFSLDTKLGGQVDLTLNKQFSAALQGLVEKDVDGDFKASLSLAFVKWAPGYGVEARLGRLPWSAYLVSDYRKIGFSQTWVRPPMEVYYLSGSTMDGGDLTWRTTAGSVALKAQLAYGKSKEKLQSAEISGKQVIAVNLTADIDALTLRASHIRLGKFTLKSDQVDQMFQAVRYGLPANALFQGSPALPGNPALADEYQVKDKPQGYTSVGVSYDPGEWFVMSEAAYIHANGFVTASKGIYVTGGLRLGAFTPYASVGRYSHGSVPVTSHPLLDAAMASSAANDYKSTSLGVRWDFHKQADLKLQLDRFSNDSGSTGPLANVQAGFVPGRSFNVLTAAVDFLF